jgi:hypothetical protein
MSFLSKITPEMEANARRMQRQGDAREVIATAAEFVLDCAREYADHTGDLWEPPQGEPYVLAEFLRRTQDAAAHDAEQHLLPEGDPRIGQRVHVAIVVPYWANTARGAGNPQLHEPNWVPVYQPYLNTPPGSPAVAVADAVAIAARGYCPSLLRLDWEWCGIYPFGTPAYHHPAPEFTAKCVDETCDGEATE